MYSPTEARLHLCTGLFGQDLHRMGWRMDRMVPVGFMSTSMWWRAHDCSITRLSFNDGRSTHKAWMPWSGNRVCPLCGTSLCTWVFHDKTISQSVLSTLRLKHWKVNSEHIFTHFRFWTHVKDYFQSLKIIPLQYLFIRKVNHARVRAVATISIGQTSTHNN